ncbi:hypothetical protein HDV03_001860 [Kappamyces sp. JEL0829]|nr:hypothetical protein HDV03_001860 [Kappamyces sp. JEL0829]
MALPFVGAKISLISKSNIRFVGILHSINHEESSVSLEQGRTGHPEQEIPPQPNVFPLIVFKGSDVKDLKVIENPPLQENPYGAGYPPQFQASPYGYMNQQQFGYPGPQSSSFGPPMGGHGYPGAPYAPGFRPAAPVLPAQVVPAPKPAPAAAKMPEPSSTAAISFGALKPAPAKPAPKPNPPSASQPSVFSAAGQVTSGVLRVDSAQKGALQVNSESSPITSTGAGKNISLKELRSNRAKKDPVRAPAEKTFAELEKEPDESQKPSSRANGHANREKNNDNRRPPRPKMVIPTEEFDFEQSNAKFDRDEDEAREDEPKQVFYNKSSFFDDISSEAKDRAANE